ncbi:MAG: hypothetical protein JWR21_3067 [Herminiimonas sp.]|nr:hypothetical protein [Herminiimonas sp.]MDB5855729.1 hypothetical protein [Herminiimonas sp.]
MPDAPLAPPAPDEGLDGLDGLDGLVAPAAPEDAPPAPEVPPAPDEPELPGVMLEAPPLLGDVELEPLAPPGDVVELEPPAPEDDPEEPDAPEVPLAPDAAPELELLCACFFAFDFFFIGFDVSALPEPLVVASVEDWAKTCAFFSTAAAFAGSVLMVTPLPVESLDDEVAAKPAIESMARNRASEIFFMGISNFISVGNVTRMRRHNAVLGAFRLPMRLAICLSVSSIC